MGKHVPAFMHEAEGYSHQNQCGRTANHNRLTMIDQGVLVNEAIAAAVTHHGVPVHDITATTPPSPRLAKRCTVGLPNPLTSMVCCSPTERTQKRVNLARSLRMDSRLMCTGKVDGWTIGPGRVSPATGRDRQQPLALYDTTASEDIPINLYVLAPIPASLQLEMVSVVWYSK